MVFDFVGNGLLFGIFGLGPAEMIMFLAVVLLLFGGAKLPSLMRNLGRSANEFKRGMNESVDDDDSEKARNGSGV